MAKTAIFWIRDGVLINRMAVNAVAFAFSCLFYFDQGENPSVTNLVNFAFENSGVSCAEKIARLNSKGLWIVTNIEAAVDLYNQIASDAALKYPYFDGTKQLLEKTKELGCLNFITSAVEQNVLDEWSKTEQARSIASSMDEILGWRSPDISKGRGHFAYVQNTYGVERIIYVADAVAEIADGYLNSEEFAVVPIGFANVITAETLARAYDVVLPEFLKIAELPEGDLQEFSLEFAKLSLPDQNSLQSALTEAGAAHVVSGAPEDIMGNLSLLLGNRII